MFLQHGGQNRENRLYQVRIGEAMGAMAPHQEEHLNQAMVRSYQVSSKPVVILRVLKNLRSLNVVNESPSIVAGLTSTRVPQSLT